MTLRIWTIYDHPIDMPNHYVARQFEVTHNGPRPTESVIQSDSLETIREMMLVEFGLTKIERYPEDDPKIIEVWI